MTYVALIAPTEWGSDHRLKSLVNPSIPWLRVFVEGVVIGADER